MRSEECRECNCTPGILAIDEGRNQSARGPNPERVRRWAPSILVRDGESRVDVLCIDDLVDHGHREVFG